MSASSSIVSASLNSLTSSSSFSLSFCQYSFSSAICVTDIPPFFRICSGILSLTSLLYFISNFQLLLISVKGYYLTHQKETSLCTFFRSKTRETSGYRQATYLQREF